MIIDSTIEIEASALAVWDVSPLSLRTRSSHSEPDGHLCGISSTDGGRSVP
jgi:hypothetical protein